MWGYGDIYKNAFFFLNKVSTLDAGEWLVSFTSPSPFSLGKIR